VLAEDVSRTACPIGMEALSRSKEIVLKTPVLIVVSLPPGGSCSRSALSLSATM
jgi:hypothetical protein